MDIIKSNWAYISGSQEEISLKVEMLYRLFLSIDISSLGFQETFSRGCVKFHSFF